MVEYKTIAGQRFPLGSLGRDDLRLRIRNTTEDECREYAQALHQAGYRKCAEKQISAGSHCSYNVNLFYAFQNDKNNVFVFWEADVHSVFITIEPLGLMPKQEQVITTSKPLVSPTVTQLNNRGLGYVIQLENGEFIIVDGGVKGEDGQTCLYDLLKEKSLNEKPKIALWILTHSHKDHIGLATEFVQNYAELVDVQAFAYQFPNCDKVQVAMESVAVMKEEIEIFEKNVQTFCPNADVYTLHTGQSYFYAGVEIEILYSLDDTYPYPYASFNDTSAAFRMMFKNGKTVMFLGDCMNENCKRLDSRYGDYLKSDVLQVSHHGLIGGDKGLYQRIDPAICFWAITEKRFLGLTPNQRYQWCLGEGGCDYNAYLRDDTIRKRTHYHASVTTTIEV